MNLEPRQHYVLRVIAVTLLRITHSKVLKVETQGSRFTASLFGRPFFPPAAGLLAEVTTKPSAFVEALSDTAESAMIDFARLEYAKNSSEEHLAWLGKVLGLAFR